MAAALFGAFPGRLVITLDPSAQPGTFRVEAGEGAECLYSYRDEPAPRWFPPEPATIVERLKGVLSMADLLTDAELFGIEDYFTRGYSSQPDVAEFSKARRMAIAALAHARELARRLREAEERAAHFERLYVREEQAALEATNAGATIVAEHFRRIAETGEHPGSFTSEIEAAAQAVLRLHRRLREVEDRQ